MTGNRLCFTLSILFTILIGYYDYRTGVHVSMMLLYAIPVLVSAWYCGKFEGFFVSVLATASWLLNVKKRRPTPTG